MDAPTLVMDDSPHSPLVPAPPRDTTEKQVS